MAESKWTFKKHKPEIITGIVVAVILGVGSIIWNFASSVPDKIMATNGVKATLEKYASDISNNTFDANYYFANSVPLFFETKDMSPRKINEYWKNKFERTFTNNIIRFDYETLKVDCKDDCYDAHIVMYHTYFKTDEQKQFTNEKSEYELKFDEEFKIVEVTQKVWGE